MKSPVLDIMPPYGYRLLDNNEIIKIGDCFSAWNRIIIKCSASIGETPFSSGLTCVFRPIEPIFEKFDFLKEVKNA